MIKETLSLSQLTPEQKKQLFLEMEQEQKEKSKQIADGRKEYKKLVNDQVKELFPLLMEASKILGKAKKKTIGDFQALVAMKAELYGKEEEQTSHSFTNEDGTISIIIGYNMLDGWDDTAGTGIAKVNEYIRSLATDEKSKALVDAVMKLLAKDNKGNLKASRVLQLKQMAEKSEDAGFVDAVNIIQQAYRPVKSKEFVRCMYTAPNGEKTILPLSITDADLLDDEAVTA